MDRFGVQKIYLSVRPQTTGQRSKNSRSSAMEAFLVERAGAIRNAYVEDDLNRHLDSDWDVVTLNKLQSRQLITSRKLPYAL
jgi:hypothetical protein